MNADQLQSYISHREHRDQCHYLKLECAHDHGSEGVSFP